MKYKVIASVIASVMLAACSVGDFKALEQTQYSGQNVVEAEFQIPKDQRGMTSFKATFAKDSDSMNIKVDAGDGRSITLSGENIRGTEHIKALGETIRSLSSDNNETVRQIAPNVVETLGKVFMGPR